jgi:hypothetical protein
MTEDERDRLITYIEGRMCKEHRSGEQCMDGPVGARVARTTPHPACEQAAEMVEIVRRT